MNKRFIYAIAVISLFACANAKAQQPSYIELLKQQPKWVDSVFNKLSTKHKIAQLLFVRAHTNLSKAYQDSVGKVIRRQKLGGVVFFSRWTSASGFVNEGLPEEIKSAFVDYV